MSAEAIVLLRQALQPAGGARPRQHAALARLRQIQMRTHLPAGASPAEQLVRDDRNAAG